MSNLPNFPTIRPSLLLDFANSKQVDPRITFTRASTATYFDAQGVLRTAAANVLRINHNPATGECDGALIEDARTNLLTYSEQFDNAAWTKTNATVTANATTAPDGALTADKLVEDTTANITHLFRPASYAATGITLTASIYAKAAERSRVRIDISNFLSGAATATFNLSAGSISGVGSNTGDYTGVSATCTSVGNGWYRCTLTATKGSANSNNIVVVQLDNGTTSTYTGDGTSGLYIWGAQLEVGTFPTSYIPTTSAAATRAADAASMFGTNFSEWYRQDEGTFVVVFDAPNIPSDTATYGRVYSAHGGTNANSIDVLISGGWNPDRIGAIINVGGVASFDSTGTANGWVATPVAYAVNATAYKADSFATSWNGLAAATDSAGALPVVNQLNIGCYLSASQLNGHIRRIAYYPKRLTNAELQALTE